MLLPKRLLAFCLCLAVFCAQDGHIFVLHSAAWAHMAFIYMHRDPVNVALQKTLDGKHPCALCKNIGRQTASKSHISTSVQRLKLDSFRLGHFIQRIQELDGTNRSSTGDVV